MIKTVGIVGSGEDKFTPIGKKRATSEIEDIIRIYPNAVIVSGHSPLRGIDVWAEEIGLKYKRKLDIKAPRQQSWDGEYGYKNRNIDIAKSDIVFIIVADKYPEGYKGRLFKECYHCHTNLHIKSGGCWTGKKALEFGNLAMWIIIKND